MQFTIDSNIDLTPFKNLIAQARIKIESEESHSAKAVRDAGDILMATWTRVATSGRLKRSTGGYTNAIRDGLEYPYENNPLHLMIVNRHPAAVGLERGHDAYDLKKMLYTSKKVRVSKQGKKYLIIPFQHGTPSKKGEGGIAPNRATLQTMPKDVYRQALGLDASMIAGKYKKGSQKGANSYWQAWILKKINPVRVTRNKYSWGEHLTDMGNYGKRANAKFSIYEGMYRFKTNKGSVYMTFRIMHEDSQGWIHPAQPALHIAEDAVKQCRQQITTLLAEGVRKDMAELGIE